MPTTLSIFLFQSHQLLLSTAVIIFLTLGIIIIFSSSSSSSFATAYSVAEKNSAILRYRVQHGSEGITATASMSAEDGLLFAPFVNGLYVLFLANGTSTPCERFNGNPTTNFHGPTYFLKSSSPSAIPHLKRQIIAATKGSVYSIDPATCKKNWDLSPQNGVNDGISLSTDKGTAYFYSSHHARGVAITADANGGTETFKTQLGNEFNGAPFFSDNKLYGCDDENTLAWVSTVNEHEHHTYPSPESQDAYGCSTWRRLLVFKKSTLFYIGSGNGGVHAMNTATATLLWHQQVNNGQNGRNAFVVDERTEILYSGTEIGLYANRVSDGKLMWKFPTRHMIYGSPVISHEMGVVVFVAGNGIVFAADLASGTLMFQHQLPHQTESDPSYANGTVTIADNGGAVSVIAVCAVFSDLDCPVACDGRCGCHTAGESACGGGVPLIATKCHWCHSLNMCVSKQKNCSCSALSNSKQECDAAAVTVAGCHWCSFGGAGAGICVGKETKTCQCSDFSQSQCAAASGSVAGDACKWCPHFGSAGRCINTTVSNKCDCLAFSSSASLCSSVGCEFCSELGDICLPQGSSCSCEALSKNESICARTDPAACRWCALGDDGGGICSFANNSHCQCGGWHERGCDLALAACHWCGATKPICVNKSSSSSSSSSSLCECDNFNNTQCKISETAGGCKLCSKLGDDICLPSSDSCSCEALSKNESICARTDPKACRWCPLGGGGGVCSFANNSQCQCGGWNERGCDLASAACDWCGATKPVCVNKSSSSSSSSLCECDYFNNTQCKISQAAGGCKFCSTQNLCSSLAVNCDCSRYDKHRCQLAQNSTGSGCRFCSDVHTCIDNDDGHATCVCAAFNKTVCQKSSQLSSIYSSSLSSTFSSSSTSCRYCDAERLCVDIADYPKCACSSLSRNSCRSARPGSCTFCEVEKVPKFINQNQQHNDEKKEDEDDGFCVNETIHHKTCACETFSDDETQCRLLKYRCVWCGNLKTCTTKSKQSEAEVCKCAHFADKERCACLPPAANCTWCGFSPSSSSAKSNNNKTDGACVSHSQSNAAQNDFGTCSCYSFDLNQCTLSGATCAFLPKVQNQEPFLDEQEQQQQQQGKNNNDDEQLDSEFLQIDNKNNNDNHSTSAPTGGFFCAPASQASCAPLTCASIENNAKLCEAAGCTVSSSSSSSPDCSISSVCKWYLFLSHFVPQSYLNFLLGILKDFIVLLLLSASTWLPRVASKASARFYYWRKSECRLDDTVWVCEAQCRDDANEWNDNFTNYVVKVSSFLFEFRRFAPSEVQRQQLFDAVAFSLMSANRWVVLPEEAGGTGSRTASAAALNNNNNNNNSSSNNNDNPHSEDTPLLSSPTASAPMAAEASGSDALYQQQNNQQNNQQQNRNHRRRQLRAKTFAKGSQHIFNIIEAVIDAQVEQKGANGCGGYYIHYAYSRSAVSRIRNCLNQFPDLLQLSLYVAGMTLLFLTTLSNVLNSKTSREIHKIARGCGGAIVSANLSSSSSPEFEREMGAVAGTSYGFSIFVLIFFRIVNASSFSTFALILAKFFRNIYFPSRRPDAEHHQTLGTKMSLLIFRSSTLLKVLLFYYVVIAPVPIAIGCMYGISLGFQVAVPLLVGAAALGLNVLLANRVLRDSDPFEGSEASTEDDDEDEDEEFDENEQNNNSNNNNHTRRNGRRRRVRRSNNNDDDSNTSTDEEREEEERAAPSAAAEQQQNQQQNQQPRQENLLLSPTAASAAGGGAAVGSSQQQDAATTEDDTTASAYSELRIHNVINNSAAGVGPNSSNNDESNLNQVSVVSSVSLQHALLDTLLTQILPVVIIVAMFQLSFNYFALLYFKHFFAAVERDPASVFSFDMTGRSFACAAQQLQGEADSILSFLSSFVPFF